MAVTNEDWDVLAQAAGRADIAQIAGQFGVPITRYGKGWRHTEFDSLKINGNKWKRWSGKLGVLGKYTEGGTVRFVREYTGMRYHEAIRSILEITEPYLLEEYSAGKKRTPLRQRVESARQYSPVGPAQMEPREPLRLPDKAPDADAAYHYLTQIREIHPDIVQRELASGRVYQDTKKNCVFVGRDDNGDAAFAALRSTNDRRIVKMDVRGSRKEYSWRVVPEEGARQLFVFESPIEAMSYMSILKQLGRDETRSTYLSLGGVGGAALFNCLDRSPGTEKVYICLNNDEAGLTAANRLQQQVGEKAQVLVPAGDGRDWNDLLRAGHRGERIEFRKGRPAQNTWRDAPCR